MDAGRSLRWALYFVILAGIATLLGAGLAGAGVVVGLYPAYEQLADGSSLSVALDTALPGLALALVGGIVWILGVVAAFVRVFTAAVEEQMRERFDSEKVKSEILSALEDDLGTIRRDVADIRGKVDKIKNEETANEFEFGEQ